MGGPVPKNVATGTQTRLTLRVSRLPGILLPMSRTSQTTERKPYLVRWLEAERELALSWVPFEPVVPLPDGDYLPGWPWFDPEYFPAR